MTPVLLLLLMDQLVLAHVAWRNDEHQEALARLKGADPMPASVFVHGVTPRYIEWLLDVVGAPLDAVDERGRTALNLAATLGRVSIGRLLLERGAKSGPNTDFMLDAIRANQEDFMHMVVDVHKSRVVH